MHLMCAKVKQPCLVQHLLLVLLLLKSHVNHAHQESRGDD